jgi:hypothetical protein
MNTLVTPFDRDRALEIWEQRGLQGTIGHAVSRGEDAYIHQVWNTMPGSTSYMDAFFRIMQGRIGETRERLFDDVVRGRRFDATPAERAAGLRAHMIVHAMNRDSGNMENARGSAECLANVAAELRADYKGD